MSKQYSYIQNGLTDQKFNQLPWTILTGFIIVVCAILYANNFFALIGIRENLVKMGADVFLKYLFIVVAVERAAAVFVSMFRNQNRVDWSLRINRISEILQKDNPSLAVLKQVYTREHRVIKQLENAEVIGHIDDVPSKPDEQDYIGFLTSVKHTYEFQRARFNSVSNRYIARIVFFVGILLAALGLSIFQDIFENIKLLELAVENELLIKIGLAWQTAFLRIMDIIITGGLLGGGSAGLNAIGNKVTEFLNKQS